MKKLINLSIKKIVISLNLFKKILEIYIKKYFNYTMFERILCERNRENILFDDARYRIDRIFNNHTSYKRVRKECKAILKVDNALEKMLSFTNHNHDKLNLNYLFFYAEKLIM